MSDLKKSKIKKAGLIAILIFHIFAAIALIVINLDFAKNIQPSIKVSIWVIVYLAIGLISFIMVCIFVSVVKSRGHYILISLVLPFVAIFVSIGIIGETETVPLEYMQIMASGIYLIVSLIVSLGAVCNWFKKKKENDWDSDVYMSKSIYTQIYEEYGNFDK